MYLQLSPEFDHSSYLAANPDLMHFNKQQLIDHYITHGQNEGRCANDLQNRNDFVKLIPATSKILEIGPFHNPLCLHSNVKFFDVLDKTSLIERAKKIGLPTDNIPYIDYVSPVCDLSIIQESFDIILSSHVIEHQPDLIQHLRDVHRLLINEGRYFILIPDKRYCFDHFIPESNLAGVIAAHYQKIKVHSLSNVIKHRMLTTHNDSMMHWKGLHGDPSSNLKERLDGAIKEYQKSNGAYIDVHAWYFTPNSFTQLIQDIAKIEEHFFNVEVVYPTRFGSNEFWVVLKKF